MQPFQRLFSFFSSVRGAIRRNCSSTPILRITRSFAIAVLMLIVAAPVAAKESAWWMRVGKGDPLCETLYQELNKHRPEDLGACTGSVVLALPGMKEPEGWKELDPHEHKELFKKLLQYQALGARAYFGNWPQDAELRRIDQAGAKRKTIDDKTLEKRYQEFIAGGGRMRVMTLRLFRRPWGRVPDVVYDQPQTILELHYYKPTTAMCPNAPSLNIPVRTFYVSSDLAGPDPRIPDGERSRAYFARTVVYKRATYLMSADSNAITFDRDNGDGELRPFCEIQRTWK